MTKLTKEQKKSAVDDLKKLCGDKPYNTGSNIVTGDGYFAKSLEHKYGMSLSELEKASGYSKSRKTDR